MSKKSRLITSMVLIVMSVHCGTVNYNLPPDVDPNSIINNPSKKLSLIPLILEYESQRKRINKRHADILTAIAISGGGHRSANFAVGVMAELEKYGILSETDFVSTVSGGGFAASAYISTLHDYAEEHGTIEGYSLNKVLADNKILQDTLQIDYKSTLLRGLLTPRLFFAPHDRGELLEKKIDNHILGRSQRISGRSLVLKDVFRYKTGDPDFDRKKLLPYWIANATVYNDGSRFPFAPAVLREYGVISYTHRMCEYSIIKGNRTYGDIPLSVAVTASAAFPVGVPPLTLGCKMILKGAVKNYTRDDMYLHLIDGGCSDNLGIRTAIKMLTEEKKRQPETKTRLVLIVIDAFKDQQYPYSGREREPNEFPSIVRAMEIGIDSLHINIESILTKVFRREMNVVFFNFDCIDQQDLEEIYTSLIRRGKIKKDDENAKKDILAGPRSVSTDFHVSKAQQMMLQESGRLAVRKFMNNRKERDNHSIFNQLVIQR